MLLEEWSRPTKNKKEAGYAGDETLEVIHGHGVVFGA